MRANGISQRELDLTDKVSPAKLLGLPPLDEIGATMTTTTTTRP